MKKKIIFLFLAVTLLSFFKLNAGFSRTLRSNNVVFGGIHGFTYFPNQLNVFVGDTIKWIGDFSTYNLQFTSVPVGALKIGPITSGDTLTYIVKVIGEYDFSCLKYSSVGMTGIFVATNQTFGLSDEGREFYLGMIYPSYNSVITSTVYPGFKVSAHVSTYYANEIFVSYYDASGKETEPQKITLVPATQLKIPLEVGLMQMDTASDAVSFKSCHIKSKYPITVTYQSLGACAGGSYLALPVLGLGKNYVAACYNDNPGNGALFFPGGTGSAPSSFEYSGGVFMVIGTEDLTSVKITPSTTTVTGHLGANTGSPHPYTVQLNKGQCYLVRSNGRDEDHDLSGSLIEASRPVAVISGHENAFLGGADPYTTEGRDLMIEQMTPVELWDSLGYVSFPLAEGAPPGDAGHGDAYRLFSFDNTTVKGHLDVLGISGGYDMTAARLTAPPEKLEITSPVEAYSLDGKKISVMQYDERSIALQTWQAPSMMTIVPVSRWKTSYFLSTLGKNFTSSEYAYSNVTFLNIIGSNLSNISVSVGGGNPTPLSTFFKITGYQTISNHFPNLKAASYKVSALDFLGNQSYHLFSPDFFMVYTSGVQDFVGHSSYLGNFFAYSSSNYVSESSSPAGMQLNTGVTPSFIVDTASTCNGWHICVRDTGKNDPGLKAVVLIDDPDGVYWQTPARFSNVSFDSLSTDYADGELHPHVHGNDSYCFDVNFQSPLAAASAPLAIVDNLGNAVILRLDRSASALKLSTTPPSSSRADSIVFPVKKIGEQICTTFVFKNSAKIGGTAITLNSALLTNNDTSYKVVSIIPSLPHTIAPQDSLTVQVCYTPRDSSRHRDSLIMRTDCFSIAISLDAHGSTGLIDASDFDFGAVRAGDTLCKIVQVKNVGSAPFSLTGFLLSDTINFSVKSLLPVRLNPGNIGSINICFHPQAEGPYSGGIDWITDLESSFAHSIKSHSSLTGTAVPKAGVAYSSQTTSFSIHPNPANGNSVIVSFGGVISGADSQSAIQGNTGGIRATGEKLTMFDVLGREVYHQNIISSISQVEIPIRNLSEGVYYVKLGSVTQKFVKVK